MISGIIKYFDNILCHLCGFLLWECKCPGGMTEQHKEKS